MRFKKGEFRNKSRDISLDSINNDEQARTISQNCGNGLSADIRSFDGFSRNLCLRHI